MTQKEFFTTVLAMVDPQNTEMVTFATEALAKIDLKNEKAKIARLEKSKENEPILEEIRNYLGSHKKALASELANACKVSTPKAVAMAKKLADNGEITVTEISIPKVGKRKCYSLKQ